VLRHTVRLLCVLPWDALLWTGSGRLLVPWVRLARLDTNHPDCTLVVPQSRSHRALIVP